MADALAASDAGANFLVLQSGLSHGEITTICEMVPIPVYVPSLALEEAWEFGASGINELLVT
jgi:2-methylisocitrate lyase-like PEP mutase family enzyme